MNTTSDINDPTEHPELAEKGEDHAIDWIEILSVLWNSRKLVGKVAGFGQVSAV